MNDDKFGSDDEIGDNVPENNHPVDGEKGQGTSKERKVNPENKGVKQPWNDSVNIVKDSKPAPKVNSRKYIESLTFKPSVTTKQDVYKAYVANEIVIVNED